uniref:Uncharacterized protein n=1 Tax=Arundo donax TaxID=35708 RepID=A0A0A9BSC3_ARUDO
MQVSTSKSRATHQ